MLSEQARQILDAAYEQAPREYDLRQTRTGRLYLAFKSPVSWMI